MSFETSTLLIGLETVLCALLMAYVEGGDQEGTVYLAAQSLALFLLGVFAIALYWNGSHLIQFIVIVAALVMQVEYVTQAENPDIIDKNE